MSRGGITPVALAVVAVTGGLALVGAVAYTGLQLAPPQVSIIQVVFGVLLTGVVTFGFTLWRRMEAINAQQNARFEASLSDHNARDRGVHREIGELKQMVTTAERDIAAVNERVGEVGSKIAALTIERIDNMERRLEGSLGEIRRRQDEQAEAINELRKGRT